MHLNFLPGQLNCFDFDISFRIPFLLPVNFFGAFVWLPNNKMALLIVSKVNPKLPTLPIHSQSDECTQQLKKSRNHIRDRSYGIFAGSCNRVRACVSKRKRNPRQ